MGLIKYILFFVILCLSLTGCRLNAQPVDIEATFTWTAMGDDGILGQASEYDMRWSLSSDSLTDHFNDCAAMTGMPLPELYGTVQSYTWVTTLEVGQHYYFAIKTADEVPNWSDISNIAFIYIPDDTPPAVILTLEVTL
ncbi:MAG: hypothetical protein U9N61_02700 [Euryarchaeota archaeon]|nr:hypothetical protein [Euryarchaeota archaeon]